MSTIIHVREGGGLKDVHMDKSYEKCTSGAVRYAFEHPFFEHEVKKMNVFVHLLFQDSILFACQVFKIFCYPNILMILVPIKYGSKERGGGVNESPRGQR